MIKIYYIILPDIKNEHILLRWIMLDRGNNDEELNQMPSIHTAHFAHFEEFFGLNRSVARVIRK